MAPALKTRSSGRNCQNRESQKNYVLNLNSCMLDWWNGLTLLLYTPFPERQFVQSGDQKVITTCVIVHLPKWKDHVYKKAKNKAIFCLALLAVETFLQPARRRNRPNLMSGAEVTCIVKNHDFRGWQRAKGTHACTSPRRLLAQS